MVKYMVDGKVLLKVHIANLLKALPTKLLK